MSCKVVYFEVLFNLGYQNTLSLYRSVFLLLLVPYLESGLWITGILQLYSQVTDLFGNVIVKHIKEF